jgi:hypothetical protein
MEPQIDNMVRCRAGSLTTCCFTAIAALLPLVVVGCSPYPRSPEATTSPSTSTASQAIAAKYDHQLARRPSNTPEGGKVYVVIDGKKRWVVHVEWIRGHGYSWPNDVHEVSASDLDAIPTGPLIDDIQ